MLLTQADKPFTREGWTFELKYDGWRCLAEIRDGTVRLQSRRGSISRGVGRRSCKASQQSRPPNPRRRMCVLDDLGRSDFDRLHLRESGKTYCAFDLLVHNGVDIMSEPLVERKRRLALLLAEPLPSVLLVALSIPKASGCISKPLHCAWKASSASGWTRCTSPAFDRRLAQDQAPVRFRGAIQASPLGF
jgi:ATP-dependent DNA ligase